MLRYLRCGTLGSPVLPLGMQALPQAPIPKPKLLDQGRIAFRSRHCSKRNERTYAHWIKRYISFILYAIRPAWQRQGKRILVAPRVQGECQRLDSESGAHIKQPYSPSPGKQSKRGDRRVVRGLVVMFFAIRTSLCCQDHIDRF
jgi:hypothetical protein